MNRTFLATPDSRPQTARAAARPGGGRFPRDLPVSRALHPIEVDGIEALRRIGRSR